MYTIKNHIIGTSRPKFSGLLKAFSLKNIVLLNLYDEPSKYKKSLIQKTQHNQLHVLQGIYHMMHVVTQRTNMILKSFYFCLGYFFFPFENFHQKLLLRVKFLVCFNKTAAFTYAKINIPLYLKN